MTDARYTDNRLGTSRWSSAHFKQGKYNQNENWNFETTICKVQNLHMAYVKACDI